MSATLKKIAKDVLLIGGCFVLLSGAYYGFAVAERYRAGTLLLIKQSNELIALIQAQRPAIKDAQ